ncbi:hypothetical protein [Streptomyces sp. RPT161]|uniref:hypothetical protein n=1 Tax=Streptomyces sp. RPT161 TaxID=3015993 RepID=UPI0022B8EA90|nr:hypothetical protein [Streptomyces sp. RPT161]
MSTYAAAQLAAALSQLTYAYDLLAAIAVHWPEPRRRRIPLTVPCEVAVFGVRRCTAAELEAHVAVRLGEYRESVEFDAPTAPVACVRCAAGAIGQGPVRSRGNPEEMVFLCDCRSSWVGTASPR